jgi:hypothetical protein
MKFDLDCDGGIIFFADRIGRKLAEVEYPVAMPDISYARTVDAGDEWEYCAFPTHAASNNGASFATERCPEPEFTVPGGVTLEGDKVNLRLKCPEGMRVLYTIDTTQPTLESDEWSGTKRLTSTTIVRAMTVGEGYLPSRVVTQSYIFDDHLSTLPVVSIVTDKANLWNATYGIYTTGTNGIPGNGSDSPRNWNRDWSRPANMEYFVEGEAVVSQPCDIAISGGWSRGSSMKSLKVTAKKKYDLMNSFDYSFFPSKPGLKYKSILLRNGGNDWSNSMMKDALLQMTVAEVLDIEYQSYQPAVHYINGDYYGIINLRERNNTQYVYSNFGWDEEEIDMIERVPNDVGYYQIKAGDTEAIDYVVELASQLPDDEVYAEIAELVDINGLVNYLMPELWTGNWDWPQNNVKGFRYVNDGKFRFVLFDLDGAFSTSTPFATFFGKQNYTFDSLHGFDHSLNKNMSGTRRNGEIKFVTLFKNMLKNETFRKKFIDTFCVVGGSIFQPSHVKRIIDDMSSYLSTGGHVGPNGTANDIKNNFTLSYNNNMMNQLKSCSDMKLSATARQSVSISTNTAGAKILVNDTEVPYSEFNGYLFAPITLKAEAPAGYKFVGWTSNGTTKRETIFDMGSVWKYYDQGSLDGSNWTARIYSDTQWEYGASPIGYGKDQPTTTESNLSCYYFRKSFTLDKAPATDDEFVLDFIIDDGMVIYVNGVEAGRYNMNSGNVSYDTFATTYTPGNPDTGTLTLSGSLFKKGTNIIAVEVHNNQLSSSDIVWNAALSSIIHDNNSGYISNSPEYTLSNEGSLQLRAVFEEVSEEELIAEGITPVRINEVSAANSMYINDYFKKNDWIELYNTTAEDIDIAGMYISDNAEKPQKYQVPADDAMLNTIVPANGYKVIWCDKLENIGADIHTSFKLAAEGGNVLITTDSYADTLAYDAHIGTQTFGRYPDGASNTYAMNIPTIAKSNMLSSYDTLFIEPVKPEPNAIRPYIKEGGITIAYIDGTVNVKSEESPISSISIYNTLGMPMPVNAIMRAGRQFASLNVAALPKGIYVVKATTQMGDECHIKFIMK